MAYPLGVHFHVPHGEALSMLLPTVMKINHEKDPETYAALWDDAFPGQGAQLSRVDKSRHLIEHVEQLIARANLKFCLTDYGATETDLEEMSRKALDLKSALLNNPVDFERQDARRALVTIL
jgi:alcohol dehydrogenase class IV